MVKKWFLLGVGTCSVGLAFLGLLLPLLPTTPFLLLAAACYVRSSHRFYQWLMTHRWFGNYIRNYREGRGIPLVTKVVALILLWGTIGYSALFVVASIWLRTVLALIALGVTIHLVSVKTLKAPTSVTHSPESPEYE